MKQLTFPLSDYFIEIKKKNSTKLSVETTQNPPKLSAKNNKNTQNPPKLSVKTTKTHIAT